MSDPRAYIKEGLQSDLFAKIATARWNRFETLASKNHSVAAVYMAGYALEAVLKCAICKTLNLQKLPQIFLFASA